MRNCPAYLRLVDEEPIKPGAQILWLAHLSGRGDYFFPVPGVVIVATKRRVRIVVQVFGGDMVQRLVPRELVLLRSA
jgi:hypothetical protein